MNDERRRRRVSVPAGGSLAGERARSRVGASAARSLAAALLTLAGAAMLAGCGGGSSSGGRTSTPTTATATIVQSSTVQSAREVHPAPAPAGAKNVVIGPTGPVKARSRAGTIDDEVNASGAKTLNPCTLVSRAEAQAILAKPVGEPVDARQGPTCLYRAQGTKNPIALAVQATHFSTVKPQAQLQDRISLNIARHRAYCGVLGTPTLIVLLRAGRFLSVVAPCPIAASFATKALGRVS